MPLIAQVTGAVAVTALLVGPWWASATDTIQVPAAIPAAPVVPATAVPAGQAVPIAHSSNPAPLTAARPAHLNLDVRHSFANVDLQITVDGKPALSTRIAGNGKRFKMFGKRAERGYTRTLDLSPGVHLVRVRVLSAEDKFDQTRVERFDLGSASVASMRISADKSGLALVAERPPAPAPVEAAAPPPVAPAPAASPVQAAPAPVPPALAPQAVAQTAAAPQTQDANTAINLLQSVRSMLIGIAGFVASTATAFMVQEWLKSRKGLIFANAAEASQYVAGERRRRRRHGRNRAPRDSDSDSDSAIEPADQGIRPVDS